MSALAAIGAYAIFPALAAPQNCLWDENASVPLARVEAHSVVIDDRLYLFGGFYNFSLDATPRTDVYDPSTDVWTRLADMPQPLTHHTAAVDGGTVWTVGGFLGDHPGPAVRTVHRYDVSSDTWSAGPDLPDERAGGALVRSGRNLHYFGGFADRVTTVGDHFVLDLDDVAAGWDTTSYAPLPIPRGHLSGAVLNGVIYAIGGQVGHDINPQDLDLVDVYDASADAWVPIANLPFPRSHFEASTFVHAGRIVIAGGRNNQPGGSEHVVETTAFDPLLGAWVDLPPLPIPLVGPSVKALGDQLYVTTGGSPGSLAESVNFVRDLDATIGALTRVNAGGPGIFLSQAWCADAFFAGGESFRSPGSPEIAATAEDELYRTEHVGTSSAPDAFAYHFPATEGSYRLKLHFAELAWTAPGARVFDVALEGATVLDDYDIVAEVGPLTATVHTFDAYVDDGSIDLAFSASVDRPKISAIEISRLPDGFIDTYCLGGVNSTGVGATLGFVGTTSVAEDNFRLVATGLPPNRLSMFFVAPRQDAIPFGGGSMCLAGTILSSSLLSTGPQGHVELPVAPQLFPLGHGWNFQMGYLDAPPFPFNFTDAIQLHFTP